MLTRLAGVAALMISAAPLAAQESGAQDGGPLSAIDWLSQSISAPAGSGNGGVAVAIDEPPVTGQGGALPEPVATTSLDGPAPDGVGLIPAAVSGLPHDLWGAGLTREIAAALVAHPDDDLPALRQLVPHDPSGRG